MSHGVSGAIEFTHPDAEKWSVIAAIVRQTLTQSPDRGGCYNRLAPAPFCARIDGRTCRRGVGNGFRERGSEREREREKREIEREREREKRERERKKEREREREGSYVLDYCKRPKMT